MCSNVKQKYSIWIFLLLAFWDYLWPLTQCYTQQNTFFIVCPVWKGIRVTMLDYSKFDILASIPIWLYYIPFLLFAILLPCIWHLSFVHAEFSLCNVLCHSSFYHYSYSVLPLFLLRHAIIASSMLTAIIHPDGASLIQTNFESVPIHRVYTPPPHREGSEECGARLRIFLHWNSRTKCQRYDGITLTNHQCKLTCIWRDIWIYFPCRVEVAFKCGV